MSTAPVLPVAEALTEPATRPLRITVVQTGDWPSPATVLGHADAWDIAAQAREHFEMTGCQPVNLPGFTPAGERI